MAAMLAPTAAAQQTPKPGIKAEERQDIKLEKQKAERFLTSIEVSKVHA